MRRREFVAGLAATPLVLGLRRSAGSVRFGMIADLHHGLAPDAMSRLRAFVEAAKGRELDFVIQMGDFCYAKPESAACAELFDSIECPRRHVLGNHDMDVGSKADVMRVWGMPRRYDSFDAGGVHFVVLDLNHIVVDGERVAYADSNFYIEPERRAWADEAQLAWLRDDLARAAGPVVVFSHQPIGFAAEVGGALPASQAEVFEIVREAGVDVCLSGHMHVDRHEERDGVHCVCVNSASYFWRGGMRPYADPLFAFTTIEDGTMTIEGAESELAKEEDRIALADVTTVGFGARISDRVLGMGEGRGGGE